MPYATLQQLTDRYGAAMLIGLTDRGQPASGVMDEAVINRALADADALIDGYLAARYALPLAQIPALIASLAQSITIWTLHAYAPDPKIEADYKDALRALRDISSGAIRIPVAGLDPQGTGGSGARITDRERPLTADNLKGFI